MNYITKGTNEKEGKVVAEADGIEFVFFAKEKLNLPEDQKKAMKQNFELTQKTYLCGGDRLWKDKYASKKAYRHMLKQVAAIFEKWKKEKLIREKR